MMGRWADGQMGRGIGSEPTGALPTWLVATPVCPSAHLPICPSPPGTDLAPPSGMHRHFNHLASLSRARRPANRGTGR